ncbi:MAG TPA: amino acid ABC transporter permease [Thermoplasmata archaeon]|jgi:His/Glu/Gln/Arg/opine family amino acid ABC transporter permease subunit|nr:amino acid ABC transporter permease [Thermoplasmata archaeon]
MTMTGRAGRRTWFRGRENQFDALAGIGITVLLFFLFFVVVAGTRPLDVAYMQQTFWTMVPAAAVSLIATLVSFFVGLPIGMLVGWLRTLRGEPFRKLRTRLALPREPMPGSRRASLVFVAAGGYMLAGLKRFARRIADGYVELMRGTPLFVQMLFVWSLLLVRYPRLDNLALVAGTLAMTANTGGYQGEIFRGGFQTVHTGQLEAARAIGLTRLGTMRYIVLPQSLRLVTPPLLNEFIGLFKASTILFYIGVQELAFKFRQLANFESRVFELFVVTILLFLLITLSVSKFVSHIEHRYRIPGLGVTGGREGGWRTALLARKTSL